MMAERSKNMLAGLNTSQGGSRVKADLGNQSKWGMADLQQFKQLLLQYQTDLASLAAHREKERQALREIQSNILKGGILSICQLTKHLLDTLYSWYTTRRGRKIQQGQG